MRITFGPTKLFSTCCEINRFWEDMFVFFVLGKWFSNIECNKADGESGSVLW